MERPRNWNYWLSGSFLVVASVAVGMKRRVSGRELALSTVIKLIFEGFAGMAYLTVFHASGAASD
jgi:hypothetical protein